MKKIYLILGLGLGLFNLNAQDIPKLDDFGRIALNAFVSSKVNIPADAKDQLTIKLKQIASNYGMGESSANPRFAITATISVTSKDILAGPPQQIAQNMDITFFIGDAIENKVFTNIVIQSSGVGINENKAFIDAIKQINTKNKKIQNFIEEGKAKIVSYYAAQCDLLMEKISSLKNQERYNEALYTLALVPDVCKDCYTKCLVEMAAIYQAKIDSEGKVLLDKAISVWAANPTEYGAQEAKNFIMEINPKAKCIPDATKLIRSIYSKLVMDEKVRLKREEELEKRQHELDVLQEQNETELEKRRINAVKQVALEFAKNQPKRVTYNTIYWN